MARRSSPLKTWESLRAPAPGDLLCAEARRFDELDDLVHGALSSRSEQYHAMEVGEPDRTASGRLGDHQPAPRRHRAAAISQNASRIGIVPVTQRVDEKIRIASGRHLGEEVAADERSALGDAGLLEECRGNVGERGEIEDDSLHLRVAPQDGDEETPLPAPHVDDRVDAPEIVVGDGGAIPRGDSLDRHGCDLGVSADVSPVFRAERIVECGPTRANGVSELRPSGLHVRLAEFLDERHDRIVVGATEPSSRRRQTKPAVFAFRHQIEGSETAEQPRERLRMRSGLSGELLDRRSAALEKLGNAELGRDL